ncbi:tape measure protein [Azospirillum sp. Sh1]|uniref:tape measure protein n=1 Tax=Azospirillum sp. Sh1 TaxID=2607285 RepID=UPI0011EC7FC9|nr:tape measure protein [Azospirillum sp. Sh1]KAA0573366.1 tape measure protein [Azospirillum sp. Sh1]
MSFNVGTLFARLDLDNRSFIVGMAQATGAVTTFQRLTHNTSNALGNLAVAFSAVGIGEFIALTIKAGEEMTGLQRKLEVFADSYNKLGKGTTSAQQEIEYLRETAIRTGASFDSLQKTFAQLAPVAVSNGVALDTVKKAIEGTIGAGSLMGTTSEELHRAFVAIRQVIGKDKLQMEELRGQLGEALPNSMQIVVNGLNRLIERGQLTAQSIGLIGTNSRVTIASLQRLISEGKISGDTFVNAWAAGTAEFAKFAELTTTTVTGQMERMATVMKTNIGSIMRDSELNLTLAALTEAFVDWFDRVTTLSGERSKEIGQKLISGFMDFGQALARLLDETRQFNSAVLAGVVSLVSNIGETVMSLMRILPADLIEMGIIGYLIFGRGGIGGLLRGILKVVTGVAALGEGLKWIDSKTGWFGLKEGENPFDVAIDRLRQNAAEVDIRRAAKQVQYRRNALAETESANRPKIDALNAWIEQNAGNPRNPTFSDNSGIFGRRGGLYTLADVMAKRDELLKQNADARASFEKDMALYKQAYNEGLELQTKQLNGKGGVAGFVGDMLGNNPLDEPEKKVGEFEQTFIDFRNSIARATAANKAMIDESRRNSPSIVTEFMPGDAISGLSQSDQQNLLNMNAGVLEMVKTLQGNSSFRVAKITESVVEKLNKFNEKYGKVFDEEESGKTSYGLAKRGQYQSQFILEGAQALSSVSLAGLSPEHKAETVAALRKAVADLRQRAVATGVSETVREIDLLGKDVEKKIADDRQRDANKADAAAKKALQQRIKALTSESKEYLFSGQFGTDSLAAYVAYGLDGDLGMAQSRKRQADLLRQNLDPNDKNLNPYDPRWTQEQRLQNALEGERLTLRKSILQTEAQLAFYRDDSRFELALQKENQALQLQLEQLREKLRLLADPKYQSLFQQSYVANLNAGAAQTRLTAATAMSPEGRDAQFNSDAAQEEMSFAKMTYDYSLSLEQRLQLTRTQNIQNFVDAWSSGLADILTGQESIGKGFAKMIGNMAQMLAQFFARWMVQQAALGIMGFFGIGGTTAKVNHTGAMVGDGPSRIVPAGLFANAPRFHTGGLVSGEVPIIARKGEAVFTPEQMDNADSLIRAATQGGQSVTQNVTVNVSGGSSGNKEQDKALAERIGATVKEQLRAMMGYELRQQMRPGGMLNNLRS